MSWSASCKRLGESDSGRQVSRRPRPRLKFAWHARAFRSLKPVAATWSEKRWLRWGHHHRQPHWLCCCAASHPTPGATSRSKQIPHHAHAKLSTPRPSYSHTLLLSSSTSSFPCSIQLPQQASKSHHIASSFISIALTRHCATRTEKERQKEVRAAGKGAGAGAPRGKRGKVLQIYIFVIRLFLLCCMHCDAMRGDERRPGRSKAGQSRAGRKW